MQACHDGSGKRLVEQRTTYAPRMIIMEVFRDNGLINLRILINHVLHNFRRFEQLFVLKETSRYRIYGSRNFRALLHT